MVSIKRTIATCQDNKGNFTLMLLHSLFVRSTKIRSTLEPFNDFTCRSVLVMFDNLGFRSCSMT